MNILVTGGKGVVGTTLVRELTARKHTVWVCDLQHSHEERYVRCDVAAYRQLESLFDRVSFDCVYHLAAEYGRWNGESYYEQVWKTNAIGTKNILKLQEKHGFRLIFTSSSEVYGDYSGVMSEDVMETHEIKQLNDYAISKWANEMQILNHIAMYGSEIMRVRLFNTYGPGEYYTPFRSAISIFVYKALRDLPYTVYLKHKRTSVFIDDCAAALASLTDSFQSGAVYNISGAQLHDMKFISDLILEHLGKTDEKVIYRDEEPFTTRIKVPDVGRITRDYQYQPKVTLQEGIPRTIQWMKEAYGI